MSEYQYVTFRAIDTPVSEKNLEYMEEQSSHAEVTKWSFRSEYHRGDFHGDALEMLRRGYDIHLHYASFGTRTLMIRFANRFSDHELATKYLDNEALRFIRDKNAQSGILIIEPVHEAGDLEQLWDIEELMDRLIPLRAEILAGDLRPLYLAQLAIGQDFNHDPESTMEGPVPAGLGELTDAQAALSEMYGLGEALIAAAAQGAPATPKAEDTRTKYVHWIRKQPTDKKDRWLSELIHDPQSAARDEIQAAFRKDHQTDAWPTVMLNRSMEQLESEAEVIATRMEREANEQAARKRAKKLDAMAADPASCLRETEKLVAKSSVNAYAEAAELLADLREALTGTTKSGLADTHAHKLRRDYPKKHQLASALRRAGFLNKASEKRK